MVAEPKSLNHLRSTSSIAAWISASKKRCISFLACAVVSFWARSRWTLTTISEQTTSALGWTYDWRVELVQVLPFALSGCHHVDLFILKGLLVAYPGQHAFGVGTERAIGACEERQPKGVLHQGCRCFHRQSQEEVLMLQCYQCRNREYMYSGRAS